MAVNIIIDDEEYSEELEDNVVLILDGGNNRDGEKYSGLWDFKGLPCEDRGMESSLPDHKPHLNCLIWGPGVTKTDDTVIIRGEAPDPYNFAKIEIAVEDIDNVKIENSPTPKRGSIDLIADEN